VSHRPLVLISVLALGDYLLWNWSLNGGHDVLALVSGLTLPPLAIACLWLLVLTVARLVAHSTHRSPVKDVNPVKEDQALASTHSSASSSSKLAA
jgi:hypothetical protein